MKEFPEWLPEPFRIKAVERIRLPSLQEREQALREAGYNLFRVPARLVFIDLLTDSGTGAMSQEQWAALMQGDEAYAGSRSFERLQESVREIFGFPYVLPAHQGRGVENMVFRALLREKRYVPGNFHFDTTRAHIEDKGGVALDFIVPEAREIHRPHPFKGNLDLERLRAFLEEKASETACVLMTLTCNSVGGQPVSMENMRAVRELCDTFGVPLFVDGARIMENAFLIKKRERGYEERSVRAIVRELADLADAMLISAKKDALVNIGGVFLTRDRALYEEVLQYCILHEGYLTYGGLAGRDLEAMAIGFQEALDEQYLEHRIGQVRFLADALRRQGIPLQEPPGGHGVFVDAGALLPHIPWNQYPAQALAVELYRVAGVRAVEIGSLLMGRDPETGEERRAPAEFLRLAIPRRVYTEKHLLYVAEALGHIREYADRIRGMQIVEEPPRLRHFLCTLRPLGGEP